MLSNFLAVEPRHTLPDIKLQRSTRYLTSLKLAYGQDFRITPYIYYDTAEIPKLRGLKIVHSNMRRILNKMDDVRSLISKRFDIFTFSETWLNPSIKDSELNIPGYTLVRQDRTGKRTWRWYSNLCAQQHSL